MMCYAGLEEMESMENLHLQFSAIKVATDNFASANKIGRGGFGVVYMVCLHSSFSWLVTIHSD